MSTKVETISVSAPAPAPASGALSYHSSRRSVETLPPDYAASQGVELGQLRTSSSADSLPQYDIVYKHEAAATTTATSSSDSSSSDFYPTKSLQVQTRGHPLISLPIPPRPDPIYIYNIAPTGELDQAELVSIRPKRGSGSCFLARANDPDYKPLCSTTYRFGPNKPPKIKLLNQNASYTEKEDEAEGEEITIECKGTFTRATVMRTPYGSFEWRYSTRAERRAAGGDVDSLLILDQTTTVSLAGGKTQIRRRKVGQLVRGGGSRTEGTKRCTAGNGGRLMLDLREWADRKGEAAQVELLAVASCVSMLKKEVDRRRLQQAMVIAAGVSGG
ncbi:hypothetical protein BGZ63DRAFT_383442 [Mariannaea sp. PMI_226]|nr:hypothetical protein BGZ63DRAFT_383442 [Mariannaea sp. PMI_226]